MKLDENYPYAAIRPGNLLRLQSRLKSGVSFLFLNSKNNAISNEEWKEMSSAPLLFLGVQTMSDVGKEVFEKNEVTWFLSYDKIYLCLLEYYELEQHFVRAG